MPNIDYLAQNLRFLLDEYHKKIKTLSEDVEISVTTIQKLERYGLNSNPSFVNVEAIASYFGLTTHQLCNKKLDKKKLKKIYLKTFQRTASGKAINYLYVNIKFDIESDMPYVKKRVLVKD